MPISFKKPAKAVRKKIDLAKKKRKNFLARRPHRSFRITKKRDYRRSLNVPSTLKLSGEVNKLLWKNKKIFLPLIGLYIVLYAIIVGVGSQETYGQIGDFLKENGGDLFSGGLGGLLQSGVTIASIAINGLGGEPSDAQRIFGILLSIIAWMVTVWLLRNIVAGHKVKVRDGLYNSGGPLISTVIIFAVIALQLLPVAIAAFAYSAASTSGLIAGGGVEAMLFWGSAFLLGVLSLYWITSSLFALVLITLPGMYPYKALKTAGDIVLGRRTKILFRWLFILILILLSWFIIMVVIALLDMGLKVLLPAIGWLPIVPVGLVVVSAITVFWASAYIYLFYRKIVDDA